LGRGKGGRAGERRVLNWESQNTAGGRASKRWISAGPLAEGKTKKKKRKILGVGERMKMAGALPTDRRKPFVDLKKSTRRKHHPKKKKKRQDWGGSAGKRTRPNRTAFNKEKKTRTVDSRKRTGSLEDAFRTS